MPNCQFKGYIRTLGGMEGADNKHIIGRINEELKRPRINETRDCLRYYPCDSFDSLEQLSKLIDTGEGIRTILFSDSKEVFEQNCVEYVKSMTKLRTLLTSLPCVRRRMIRLLGVKIFPLSHVTGVLQMSR